jgi:hypothetical protein
MNTDNLENETKDNSTDSTDENNNLINNSIDLLDELNCSTNDDHSTHLIIFYVIPRDDLLTFWRSVTDVIIIISNNINLYSIGK